MPFIIFTSYSTEYFWVFDRKNNLNVEISNDITLDFKKLKISFSIFYSWIHLESNLQVNRW